MCLLLTQIVMMLRKKRGREGSEMQTQVWRVHHGTLSMVVV